MKSHQASAKYQSRGKTKAIYPDVAIGDLVYINSDRSKLRPRDRYIVVPNKEGVNQRNSVSVQKFVGSQLRKKVYIVNLADIIKVPVKVPITIQQESDEENDFTKEHLKLDLPVESIHSDQTFTSSEDDSDEVFHGQADGDQPKQNPVAEIPRRSTRTRRPPTWHQDFKMGDGS